MCALTINGRRTGRAAATEAADFRAMLYETAQQERERVTAEIIAKIQEIRDAGTQEEYNSWWASTPDDKEGWYAAVRAKYDELAEVATAQGYADALLERRAEALAEFDTVGQAVRAAYGEGIVEELAAEQDWRDEMQTREANRPQ